MIWLDVTDILDWWRPPVGIIRAQIEIGNGLLEAYGEQLELCAYRQDHFVPVPTALYQAKLAALGSDNMEREQRPRSRRERVQSAYGYILDHGPGFVGAPLKAAVRTAKRIARTRSRRQSPTPQCPMASGDVYLSLGRDWERLGKTVAVSSLRIRGVYTILCCYDLIPLLLPQFYGEEVRDRFGRYLDGALSAADTLLCISETTKGDLTTYAAHADRQPRIRTVLLGSDNARVEPSINVPLQRKFILFVSTIERRKNHEILYQAYVTIRKKNLGEPPLCVYVGMPTPRANNVLFDINHDPRVRGDFLVFSHASDAALQWLYEHCLFTVFPSLYEGWGLPVAESLQNGKFVLASNASSLPEVGGNCAEYLDPWDVDAWASRIVYYASDREALRERESQIRREFLPCTWHETIVSVKAEVEQCRGD